jgi:hypothetical protein
MGWYIRQQRSADLSGTYPGFLARMRKNRSVALQAADVSQMMLRTFHREHED